MQTMANKKISVDKKEIKQMIKSLDKIINELEKAMGKSTESALIKRYSNPVITYEGKVADGCDQYWEKWCASLVQLNTLFTSTKEYLEKTKEEINKADKAK